MTIKPVGSVEGAPDRSKVEPGQEEVQLPAIDGSEADDIIKDRDRLRIYRMRSFVEMMRQRITDYASQELEFAVPMFWDQDWGKSLGYGGISDYIDHLMTLPDVAMPPMPMEHFYPEFYHRILVDRRFSMAMLCKRLNVEYDPELAGQMVDFWDTTSKPEVYWMVCSDGLRNREKRPLDCIGSLPPEVLTLNAREGLFFYSQAAGRYTSLLLRKKHARKDTVHKWFMDLPGTIIVTKSERIAVASIGPWKHRDRPTLHLVHWHKKSSRCGSAVRLKLPNEVKKINPAITHLLPRMHVNPPV